MAMRAWIVAGLAALALAGPVLAQVERRIVASDGIDLFGGDIRDLRGVDYAACIAACRAEPACRAFTFNSRANACFLKREAGAASPFAGAISGRVIDSPAPAPERRAALGFVPERYFAAARDYAAIVGAWNRANGQTPAQLRALSAERARAGDAEGALWPLAAAAPLGDAPADWTALSAALVASVDPDRYESRVRLGEAVSAALRAALHARPGPEYAEALRALGAALGPLGTGQAAVRALRLAQAEAPTAAGEAALDAAIARWGFRVTGHRVDSDGPAPRACLDFSQPLLRAGVDYGDFVRVEGLDAPVEAEGAAACVSGLEHGRRYLLTARAGLPAADGETLRRPASVEIYVRDRTPSARFAVRAFVLPKAGPVAIPVTTVNADRVALRIHRVGERNLLRAIQSGLMAGGLDGWRERQLADEIGAPVWTGEADVARALNRDVVTALPLGEAVARFAPGAYVMTARLPGATEPWEDAAAQWFVVTDLGLATIGAGDGLHVVARSLASAAPVAGAVATLLAANNEVLGTAATDAEGRATFAAALTRGTGGLAPALVTVTAGDDFAFIDVARPGFDLSDRGVEGRAAPGPVDLFLTTERGVWRPGETVHALVLARDDRGHALEGLPLTAILARPDGVEHARTLLADQGAGGRVWSVPLPASAQRGPWRLRVHLDPDGPALAEAPVLVEDFVPERLAVDLTLAEGPVDPRQRPALGVAARWLYGAPGAGLRTEAELRLAPVRSLPGWEGFRFGLYDEPAIPAIALAEGPLTDAQGAASLALPWPEAAPGTRPLEMTALARVRDTSGRSVERSLARPVLPRGVLIGLRPLFQGDLDEGAEAVFEVAAVGPDLRATDAGPLDWTLSRVETRFQWYAVGGSWNWETIELRTRVAGGTVQPGATPARVAAPTGWGRYELRVSRGGAAPAAASETFTAGWRGAGGAPDAPDRLAVGLDRPAYRVGDTARLRIAARAAGEALVAVVDTRVIALRTVPVQAGETVVELPVTEDWGAGAYVVASAIRPMEGAPSREPVRALGLAWASVEPGLRRLSVTVEAPEAVRPRGAFDATVRLDGLAPGERAFVTLAAVDVGILNLTGFEAPAPDAWAFGQRRLGARLSDLYGALIDGTQGAPGRLRSGGDGAAPLRGDPPEGATVASFSGVLTVGPDGTAPVRIDLPDFAGTVRLMAVAWTAAGLGHATAEVTVRDPVVATLAAPRFLAPGDTARVALELAHLAGPAGPVAVQVGAAGALATGQGPATLVLAAQGRARLDIPVQALAAGEGGLSVSLTMPGGETVEKRLVIPVRALDPETVRRVPLLLPPGTAQTLPADAFAGLRPGTVQATLSAGALAVVDAGGLMTALDRYPFGCTEQVTAQALPWLAAAPLAAALGLDADAGVGARIAGAVTAVLANQSGAGGFGLWRPDGGNLWLDAFVTDFLSRARAAGHAVPAPAFAAALANLRAQAGYAGEFDSGGEGLAYALQVLAREGQASIGDLRYYADQKADAFATPMALAQLGAALAAYGEQGRADALFRAAAARLGQDDGGGWRDDFGSPRRDAAAVAALAAEARSRAVDGLAILAGLGTAERLSTQEMAWTVLAAAAHADARLTVAGAPAGAVARVDGPVALTQDGAAPLPLTLTVTGVTEGATAAAGNGLAVQRRSFDLTGAPRDAAQVRQGERLVVVLTVRAEAGHEGRLLLVDPLPAGFEIDNPALVRGGDVAALAWVEAEPPAHAEFRADRLVAALDWRGDGERHVAYVVRAVTPGRFHHPAPQVEDMYRPTLRATGASGTVTVAP